MKLSCIYDKRNNNYILTIEFMTTKFQQAEELAKSTFKGFCEQQSWCKIKRFTTGQYDDYDVVYKTNNNLTIGEIKRRKNKVTDFSDWYLEKDKYDRLMEIAKLSTKQPKVTYINHFQDNVTAIWDLTKLDVSKLELQKLMMQENDYSDKKVPKWVFKLPYQLAEIKEETNKDLPLFYLHNNNN